MNDSTNVKSASTERERIKYIQYAIMSALAAGGISAAVKMSNGKKARRKANDVASSKNAIVIPIKKTNFMKDIPTPEELAESRGETSEPKQIELKNQEEKPMDDIDAKPLLADAPAEDIEARKREILRNKARRFDFFRAKAAADGSDSESSPREEDNNDQAPSDSKDDDTGDSIDGSGKKVMKEEIDGRVILRDQSGKFVSPTDPVAVAQVEKAAVSGFGDVVFHPFNTLGRIANSAADKPVLATAGFVGSIYLASKIADAINERRRAKAKERLEAARDEYVDLIEEGREEKAASGDGPHIGDLSGWVIGTSFFAPLAITAMITKRILDNRREEKKRQKEMSDSYPDEPAIMYKTSEGKEIEIDAGTAMMAILVKRGMILDAERAESEMRLEKSAQATYTDDEYNDAIQNAVKYIGNADNADNVLKMIDAYRNGEEISIPRPWYTLGLGGGVYKDPEFRRRLAGSTAFQDSLMNQFKNNQKFIDYKNNAIDDYLTSSKGWGLEKGGFLHKIISWLAKNLGFGNWMFKRQMNKAFEEGKNYMSPQEKAEAEYNRRAQEAAGMNRTDPRYAEAHKWLSDNQKSNPEKWKEISGRTPLVQDPKWGWMERVYPKPGESVYGLEKVKGDDGKDQYYRFNPNRINLNDPRQMEYLKEKQGWTDEQFEGFVESERNRMSGVRPPASDASGQISATDAQASNSAASAASFHPVFKGTINLVGKNGKGMSPDEYRQLLESQEFLDSLPANMAEKDKISYRDHLLRSIPQAPANSPNATAAAPSAPQPQETSRTMVGGAIPQDNAPRPPYPASGTVTAPPPAPPATQPSVPTPATPSGTSQTQPTVASSGIGHTIQNAAKPTPTPDPAKKTENPALNGIKSVAPTYQRWMF